MVVSYCFISITLVVCLGYPTVSHYLRIIGGILCVKDRTRRFPFAPCAHLIEKPYAAIVRLELLHHSRTSLVRM